MESNFASAAVDRRAGDQEGDILDVPRASEACLNQAYCMGNSMRDTAQRALDASIKVGNGPDMYDNDGYEG